MGNFQKKMYKVSDDSIENVNFEQTFDVGAGDSSYTLDHTTATTRFRIGVPEVNSLTIKTSEVGGERILSSGGVSVIGNTAGSRSGHTHDVYIERYHFDGTPNIRSLNLIGANIRCHTEGGGCRILFTKFKHDSHALLESSESSLTTSL